MISNVDSDDESEELNHIREKLQRNYAKGDKHAAGNSHSDGSSMSSVDDSIPQTVDNDDDTASGEGEVPNRRRVKSKHWKNEMTSSKDKSKRSALENINEASVSWNDDDDDAFDAKLAALNVLPVIEQPNRNNENPYRNHHRHRNLPRQKSPLSQTIHNPSLTENISAVRHRVDEKYDHDSFDADKENLIPSHENEHHPIDGLVINSSIQALKSSKLAASEMCESHLHTELFDATVQNSKVASCEYEEADEQTNWYDDMLSAASARPTFTSTDVSNIDPFGFDMDTDESPELDEDNGQKKIRNNGRNEFIANPVIESTPHESGVPINDYHCDALTDESHGFVENPIDESRCFQDGADRLSEIDPFLYAPQALEIREPIVHYFSLRNRPLNCRKAIPVTQIFSPPISLLWKNKFDCFNQVQSEIANMLAYSDDNVVISAPTGAGKTAVFEMTMARFFAADLQATPPGQNETPMISKRRKIVYIAPSKALCEERFADWSKRLSAMNIGIEMAVVTGDGDPSDALHDVATSHFILSTPEKWDSLTRRWTEKFYLFASVKLFLVDEVHLIADESRGCCLEAIVCRMKAIQRAAAQVNVTEEEIGASSYSNTSPDAVNSLLRFVAVSATLPNIADIATFFEANEAHAFDESYRPVPLTIHVIGQGKLATDGKNSHFMFWKNLDRNVPELVIKYSNRRPSIVFCHSKADCEKLADLLATTHNIGRRDDTTSGIACRTRVAKLQRVLIHGIAYHHAGLDVDDRRLVEDSFSSGFIRVLCATSTLAMGVNLPAHLVIVKGTSAYRGTGEGGGYHDIDHASLLQMIGRAGRPSYDSSGTAVIMTDNDSKARIEKLASSGLPPAKSQLIGSKLLETINIEISQRVIVSVKSATNWIKGSLYYIQLSQDPEAYGIRVVSNYSIDAFILSICRSAVDRLRTVGVLAITNGEDIHPLVASHIMSQRLVSFSAMTEISKIPSDASHSHVLKVVCMMDGMHFPVRRCEKKALNTIHKELKMYKLDGPLSKARVQEPWQKAFILLQAYIEEFELEGFDSATRQEIHSMVDFATRILSAIEEMSFKGSMNGNVLVQCLKLRRSLAVHLWSTKDGILRQIKGIGKALAFSLSMHGISSFEDVLCHTEAQLEKAAQRPHPFGSDIRKASASILRSRLIISSTVEKGKTLQSPDILTCTLAIKSDESGYSEFVEKTPSISYTLVAYTETERGLHLAQLNIIGPGTYKCVLPATYAPLHVQLIASIVGLDETTLLGEKDKAMPANFTSMTATISKKRIRDVSSSISGLPVIKSVPKFKTARSTLQVSNTVAATQPSDGLSYYGRKVDSTEQASVTPSPHLTPTHAASQNTHVARSRTQQYCLPSTSLDKHHVHPTMGTYPTYDQEPQPQLHSRTPPFRGNSNLQAIENCVPSRHLMKVSHSLSTKNVLTQSDSWKRLKHQQQKSQQRAFVRHSDNPFKSYKHDPNDTESYLDQLASSSSETTPTSASIIPPEGFLALETARSQSHSFSRSSMSGRCETNSRDILARRKQQHGHPVSICDILSQKAAESNVHIMKAPQFSPNVVHPQFSREQYVYPRRNERPPAQSLCGETSHSMIFLENSYDTNFPPNDHKVYGHAPDIYQHCNRNSNIYQAGQCTTMPVHYGYAQSLYEDGQPQSRCDLLQNSGSLSRGRRGGSTQCSTVDQENLEHTFF